MSTNIFHTGTDNLNVTSSSVSTVGGLDKVRVLYEYLFNSDDFLKEKNKTVFLFLEENISSKDFDAVNRFINDDAMNDLHVSLLKSSLLMTENLGEEASVSINKLAALYESKKS